MNKKLIALAIAGAFAAPAAFADTGNVVVYGRMAVSYDNVNGSSATGTGNETRSRVSSNNSYLGFKGSEDLGNGLSAVWQWEQAVAMDTQTSNDIAGSSATYTSGATGVQSKRNTYVGISSKEMGALTFGVQESPLKTSVAGVVVFGDDTIADFRTLFTNNASSVRAQNSGLYTSPNLSGFVGKAMIAAANEAGNASNTDPTFYSLSGTYANGPIFAALAYENNKSVTAGNVDTTLKTTRAAFGYTFGDAKVGLAYEKEKADVSDGTHADGKALYLSGQYNMGANAIKLAYTKRYDFGGDASCTDCGANQWAIGLDHNMSKRTKVYALYTTVRNDTNAAYSLAGGATGVAPVNAMAGDNARALSLGMTHTF